MQKKIENKWFEKLEIKVNNKLVEESKSLTTNDNNVTSDILFKEANPFIGGWEVSGSENEIVSDRAKSGRLLCNILSVSLTFCGK